MTEKTKQLMSLDVGEKRIGVALADAAVRIAIPFGFVEVNGHELEEINHVIVQEGVNTLVVGLPRNSGGEETAQTEFVRNFAKQLELSVDDLVFQDESLTSVEAEKRLKSYGKPYSKGDIDTEAAVIILQDYLEEN
ncbi:MAG: Holliday junction resolvase RuvX [Candidatus Nomurabacteria bacterium]|jgi:putative Holliday junction resolvase|nr:Holliday junction resolvase RuvX [Candidatus Nomurabacteria bacterium]